MKRMKFKAVELSSLDEDTIQNIRGWRNQDFVRQNMFCQDIIKSEEHNQWIQKLKADDNRNLFVFYLDDAPFGVVIYTYDTENNRVETVFYLIKEEYQQMGYGVILSYFASEIAYNVLGYDNGYGEILEHNKRVIRINRYIRKDIKKEQINLNGREYDIKTVKGTRQSWNDFEKHKLGMLVLKFVYEDYEVLRGKNTNTYKVSLKA